MAQVMLSTVDNPYNPFTQFDEWLGYDTCQGYHTCELLARRAYTSDAFSDAENEGELARAIDEIVRHDPLDLYCKVLEPA